MNRLSFEHLPSWPAMSALLTMPEPASLSVEVVPMSCADRDALPALHQRFKSFWSGPLVKAAPRVGYDAFFAATPPLPDVSLHPSTDPAVPGWVCVPDERIDNQALLYLHGGAYVMGTAPAYR